MQPYIVRFNHPQTSMPQPFGWPSQVPISDFGMAGPPEDVPRSAPLPPLLSSEDQYRPWKYLADSNSNMGSTFKYDKDKFQLILDVQHFAPDEIVVKTVNGFVVVEALHQGKKDDHGYICRRFVRRHALPEGIPPEAVESKLSSDGVLTIIAPKKMPEVIEGVRNVPIAQTGPAWKAVKGMANANPV